MNINFEEDLDWARHLVSKCLEGRRDATEGQAAVKQLEDL